MSVGASQSHRCGASDGAVAVGVGVGRPRSSARRSRYFNTLTASMSVYTPATAAATTGTAALIAVEHPPATAAQSRRGAADVTSRDVVIHRHSRSRDSEHLLSRDDALQSAVQSASQRSVSHSLDLSVCLSVPLCSLTDLTVFAQLSAVE